jgi:hypothetical protein
MDGRTRLMNLTEHEQKLLLRALDKASAPAEAEKAMLIDQQEAQPKQLT